MPRMNSVLSSILNEMHAIFVLLSLPLIVLIDITIWPLISGQHMTIKSSCKELWGYWKKSFLKQQPE